MAAGKGGRPRKDPALKALAGTLRADRDLKVNEDVPLGPIICPLHLSDPAQMHFKRIADMLEAQKRSSPHYADVVAILAQRLEQIERFQAVLEIEGDTVTSSTMRVVAGDTITTTMVRARPETKMLSDAMRHAQSLLGDLMLSPSTALRIATGHKAEAGAFDDL